MATNKMFSTRFFHKVSLLSLMGLIAAENTYADFSQDTSGSLYLRNFSSSVTSKIQLQLMLEVGHKLQRYVYNLGIQIPQLE